MSEKHPLLSHDKNRMVRKIVLMYPSKQYNKEKDTILCINSVVQSINSSLKQKITKMQECYDQVLPYVSISHRQFFDKNQNVAQVFKEGNLTESRILIHTVEHPVYLPEEEGRREDFLQKVELSHLVEVQVDFDVPCEVSESSFSNIKITLDVIYLQYLIEDIILDIAMFYSFEFLKYKDSTYKSAFSARKAVFAKRNDYTTYYTGKADVSPNYFCFASCCRTRETDFDYKKYDAIWKDFLAEEIVEDCSDGDAISRFSDHKNFGELSMKKIIKLIATLERGTYLLLKTNTKPHHPKNLRALLSFFNIRQWRNGKLLIVPFEQYRKFARYYPCISFFKFKVK